MAVAALYPLWGAVWGGAGTAIFQHLPPSLLPLLLVVWILIAVPEGRFLHIPGMRHVLGALVMSPVWFYVLRNSESPLLIALAAHTISRASVIAMAWVSRPSQEGMALTKRLDTFSAGLAIACGALAAIWSGPRPAVLMILAAFLILRVVREWYYRQLGGINATALTLVQRGCEISTLLIAMLVR